MYVLTDTKGLKHYVILAEFVNAQLPREGAAECTLVFATGQIIEVTHQEYRLFMRSLGRSVEEGKMDRQRNPEIEVIDVTEYITIADVRRANPAMLYYAVHSCWWTHDPAHLSTLPDSELPCDPRGSVLFQTEDVEGFLTKAEANPEHYGKHGLRAFAAAHHVNAHLCGRPWSARSWDAYNTALDRLDLQKATSQMKSDLGKGRQEIGKAGEIPISTTELIAGLKAGRITSTGELSLEILEGAQILGNYRDYSVFPIAVLIKTLRERDQEIANLNSALDAARELYDQQRLHLARQSAEILRLKMQMEASRE